MAYRLTYQVQCDWIGPGMGPVGSPQIAGQGAGGNAQSLVFVNKAGGQNITGTGTGGAIASADITTLTNGIASDISAQMNLQPAFGQMGGWPQGNP